MKLVKVNQKPSFNVRCVKCGKQSQSDFEQFYADTEGNPWHDYYCEQCSNQLMIVNLEIKA